MKVILLEDIPKIGKVGDSKDVADGYARNYLIPHKLAVLADSSASKIVEARLRQRARQEAKTEAEMAELAKLIEGKEITLKVRAGQEGKLYGSVTDADIADEL
ncbi:MAG: 50S ribosomal protein L9, partial [Dehalococcoidales bacterium]|nr:50S ribosomal protein L9 [Dehalococcoidales bacterium]